VGDNIPLGMSTVGLIMYGGTILVGRTDIMCRNALAETFNVPSNLHSWSKVGAMPHTVIGHGLMAGNIAC
jgi:hypothetical protein